MIILKAWQTKNEAEINIVLDVTHDRRYNLSNRSSGMIFLNSSVEGISLFGWCLSTFQALHHLP